jgi:hypothetical protein
MCTHHKVLESMEDANKINKQENYTVARGMKASFWSQTSVCQDRENN